MIHLNNNNGCKLVKILHPTSVTGLTGHPSVHCDGGGSDTFAGGWSGMDGLGETLSLDLSLQRVKHRPLVGYCIVFGMVGKTPATLDRILDIYGQAYHWD